MSTDSRACRWGCIACTIEHRANERSSEIGLLLKVHLVFDIWGIGIIGPRLLLRARHDLDVHEIVGGRGLVVIKSGAESLNCFVNRKQRGFNVSVWYGGPWGWGELQQVVECISIILCLYETRHLCNHSDLFSITRNLNRVEIQDQRRLNGGIPHRTQYVHSAEPVIRVLAIVLNPSFIDHQ